MSWSIHKPEIDRLEKMLLKGIVGLGMGRDLVFVKGRYALLFNDVLGRYGLAILSERGDVFCMELTTFDVAERHNKRIQDPSDMIWWPRSGMLQAGARKGAEQYCVCGPETWMWVEFMKAIVKELE